MSFALVRARALPALSMILVGLVVGARPSSAADTKSSAEVVARVDGEPIPRQWLVDRLLSDHGESTLESIINEFIVDRAAKAAGITVTEAEIDEQVRLAEKELTPGQSLKDLLKEQGIGEQSLRAQIRMRLQLKKLVEPTIQIDDVAVKEFHAAQPWLFSEPEKVHVQYIFMRNEGKAKLVLARARQGEDFSALARQYSEDPLSAEKGGDIGFIARDAVRFDPLFIKAAFSLKPGQVSDLVSTSLGYFILKVLEHKPAHNPTFEEIREKAREQLRNQRLKEAMGKKFAELRAQAKVEKLLFAGE